MRSAKIKACDFSSVFTTRKLGIRERYLQEFIFFDMDGYYEIHQKLNVTGKLLTIALMPIFIVASFAIGGVRDSVDFLSYSISCLSGKPVRKDYCHKDHKSTMELINIAGW